MKKMLPMASCAGNEAFPVSRVHVFNSCLRF